MPVEIAAGTVDTDLTIFSGLEGMEVSLLHNISLFGFSASFKYFRFAAIFGATSVLGKYEVRLLEFPICAVVRCQ